IKLLRKLKIPQKRIRELGFEYAIGLSPHLAVSSPSELVSKLIMENWHYAKRQMTWFKKDKRIQWIKTKKDAEQLIRIFLKRKPAAFATGSKGSTALLW
ncbi:MAG: hypothetical protein G01um101429_937, partial [Parcubacteria group bacterium Gr01-1014_29]